MSRETREEVTSDSVPVQLAFVLAGTTKLPFKIQKRKSICHAPDESQTGEWIDFEFDLRAAFEKQWGSLPWKCEAFRVLCEVRFDSRSEAEKDARTTVYVDDLYPGDKSGVAANSPRRYNFAVSVLLQARFDFEAVRCP